MKKTVSFILILTVLLSCLHLTVFAATPFAGGSGTADDPYLIADAQGLDEIRNYPAKHFRQVANIDLSGWGSWTPIAGFRGSYDGGLYTIRGLTITSSYTDPFATQGNDVQGLFGSGRAATFRNIVLQDICFTVDRSSTEYHNLVQMGIQSIMYIGGICGLASDSVFENCSVSGSITVSDCAHIYCGGIAGYEAASITNCHSLTDITVSSTQSYDPSSGGNSVYCGGIIGSSSYAAVMKCSNSGALSLQAYGSGSAGGICGYHRKAVSDCVNFGPVSMSCRSSWPHYTGGISGRVNGPLERCVNYAEVTTIHLEESTGFAGGVAGRLDDYDNGSIRDCYNLATGINAPCDPGRIYGSLIADSTGAVSNDKKIFFECYSLESTQLNGAAWTQPENAALYVLNKQGISLTREALSQAATYQNFDFENTWRISDEWGGAVLSDLHDIHPPVFNELIYRANHLTSGNMNILTDPVLYNTMISCSSSPSRIIIDAQGDGMHNAASAWVAITKSMETISGDPQYMITHKIEQQDILVAYILEAVAGQMEITTADRFKDVTKEVSDLAEVYSDMIKNFQGKQELFSDYCSKNMDKVMDILDEYYTTFDDQLAAFLKTAEGMKIISTCIGEAADFLDFVERVAALSAVYNSSESTKEVLRTMRQLCPAENTVLKDALNTVCELMDAASEDIMLQMVNGSITLSASVECATFVTRKLFGAAADKLWATCPVAAAALSVCKTQAYAVDKLLGVEKTLEQYFKMCALTEVDQLAGLAVNQAILDYKGSPTPKNAAFLLAAIDVKFGFIHQDYTQAIKYSVIIHDEGMLRQVLNGLSAAVSGAPTQNDLKNRLLSMQDTKDALYYMVQTSWLTPLNEDFPEVAEDFHAFQQQMKAMYWPYEVSVHCPVNVEVYDENDQLVASIVNGKARGSVGAVYHNGSKHLLLPNIEGYRILCKGYDGGEMDVQLKHYDEAGETVRTLNYHDLPVAAESTYSLTSALILADTPTIQGNTTYLADYDSNASTAQYALTVQNGYFTDALAGNTTQAAPGQLVYVSAIVPEGYRFTGWSADQADVEFADPNAICTSFPMIDRDVVITASYELIPGDFNRDGIVSDADAIYLLRYTLFPDSYPIDRPGDVNSDGVVTDADAVYLLRHTLFPASYPLFP